MSYKNLDIWKDSHALCLDIYKITNKFPKHELYNIISQLRRAALSVPTNIAEGYGRMYNKEFYKFLSQARGSIIEVEYLLLISKELGYINKEEHIALENRSQKIVKMISKFMTSMKR